MHKYLWILSLLLIEVLYLSGCGQPSYRRQALEDIQLRAQERLLRTAQVEFEQGRYAQANAQLEHFVAVHSQSPLEEKARWLLARSYKQSGELRAALEQYKVIAQSFPPGKDQQETLQHIAELEQKLQGMTEQPGQIYAVRVSMDQVSSMRKVGTRLKRLAQQGINTILLDLGCPSQLSGNTKADGAIRSNRGADSILPHRLPSYVAQIHAQKLGVLIGINLRCLGDWGPNSKVQWLDRSYDPTTRTVRASTYFDLFNPQYQEYIVKFLRKLARSDVDGILFLAQAPMGIYDGLTPRSAQLFQQTFQIRLNPRTLFSNGENGQTAQASSSQNPENAVSPSPAPEFWRWAGWKTRHRLLVLQRLITQVHTDHPNLIFGLEVHPESIENPLRALVYFSEDFLEATQRSFAFFLVSPQTQHDGRTDHIPLNTKSFLHSARRLVDRMVLVTNDPTKVWIALPTRIQSLPIRDATSGEKSFRQGIARVYNLQTFP